jgi:hypothetical protein
MRLIKMCELDCSSHYPAWAADYPEAASRFIPGGFGENFVTARMNERNVCIGDIVSRLPSVPFILSSGYRAFRYSSSR